MSRRTLLRLGGLVVGIGIGSGIVLGNLRSILALPEAPLWITASVFVCGVVGFIAVPYVTVYPYHLTRVTIRRMNVDDLIAGVVGIFVGLIIAALLEFPLSQLRLWGLEQWLPAVTALICGFVGATVAIHVKQDVILLGSSAFAAWFARRPGREHHTAPEESDDAEPPSGARRRQKASSAGEPHLRLLVDSSALIDGRIAQIVDAGFISGVLVVPRFVLEDMQHIADSSDTLRRTRGRRGLDIVGQLQKAAGVEIEISEADPKDIAETDGKLVKLAQDWQTLILTNDFNLNQLASIQGVKVLNINALARAVKPILLPGENLALQIVHEGKESGQGVGYLEDGTMIVVYGGKSYIGKTVDVSVTRVLQTLTGQLLFAQPREPQGVAKGDSARQVAAGQT